MTNENDTYLKLDEETGEYYMPNGTGFYLPHSPNYPGTLEAPKEDAPPEEWAVFRAFLREQRAERESREAEREYREARDADLPLYKIISHPNPKKLSKKITKLIHKGWKPVGGLAMYYTDIGADEFERWFAQAMILTKRNN